MSECAFKVIAYTMSLAAALQVAPRPATAQESARPPDGEAGLVSQRPDAPAPPTSGAFTADTIIVTAQKRSENLQNVPIVVTVANRQQLQDAGVQDVKGLATLTPGLTVTSTASEADTTARIRGVGTVGNNPGLESSVGIVIDGVYRPRNGVGFNDLGDVNQIEVIKGPQGTLFGKSTSAGVISVTTTAPSFKPGVGAEVTTSNYNGIGGSLVLTGPLLGDAVAGSLYFADRRRDGFLSVVTGAGPRTEDDDNNQDFFTIRPQLLVKPNSILTVRLIGDYTHHDENCCLAVQKANSEALDPQAATALNAQALVAGLAGAGGGESQTSSQPYDRIAYANRPSTQDIVDEGVSLQSDLRLPSLRATLTSITAFRNWKLVYGDDDDFTNADLLTVSAGDQDSLQFQDFSQEIRFAGTLGSIDYLAGGFYANEYLRDNFELGFGSEFDPYLNDLLSTIGLGAPNPGLARLIYGPNAVYPNGSASVDHYRQRDDTYALFTNETVHLARRLDLNVGLRYTVDNKVLNSLNQNTGGNGEGCAAISSSPASALLGQLGVNLVCLPFLSPAFDNFSNHQSGSTSNTSGTAKVLYHWTPQTMTYLSYAKGFKPGGFNLDRVGCPNAPNCPVSSNGLETATTARTNTFFKSEYSDSFEAGMKNTLFGHSLLLNGAFFYNRISNFQYNTFTGLVFVVDSLPAVYSKGVDADLLWKATRSLTFGGGLTISNTRFSHSDQETLAQSQYLGSPGARLPLAPKYSASIDATYTCELPRSYMARMNVAAKYNSDYNTDSDEDPRKQQPAYTVVDSRITVGPRDGSYDLEVWAENLFDTDYEQVAFDAPFQNSPTNAQGLIDAFLGAPRTFGVTVRAKF